jgi:hypothetical protein
MPITAAMMLGMSRHLRHGDKRAMPTSIKSSRERTSSGANCINAPSTALHVKRLRLVALTPQCRTQQAAGTRQGAALRK